MANIQRDAELANHWRVLFATLKNMEALPEDSVNVAEQTSSSNAKGHIGASQREQCTTHRQGLEVLAEGNFML